MLRNELGKFQLVTNPLEFNFFSFRKVHKNGSHTLKLVTKMELTNDLLRAQEKRRILMIK